MVSINIKPLSVNNVWKGRRFKTDVYKDYKKEMFYRLPKIEIPKGKLQIDLCFGLSSKAGDIDNPIKPLLDIFQEKYQFNDKMVYKLNVEKEDVEKGSEFIKFEIVEYEQTTPK